MAGGHGGGHDHGHGGGHGGGGGGGLPIDITVGGTPMGFIGIMAAIIGTLVCLDLVRVAWVAATSHISWEGLILPLILAAVWIVRPRLVSKIITTTICLILGTLFFWVTYRIAVHMGENIDPFFIRSPDAAGYLQLIIGWAWCLAILAIPFFMGFLPVMFAGWLWFGKTPKGHDH